MRSIPRVVILLALAGMCAPAVASDVRFRGVFVLRDFVELPADWRSTLDCRAVPQMGIRTEVGLDDALTAALNSESIHVGLRGQYEVTVYITDFLCASNGVEVISIAPLDLFGSVDKRASFFARAVVEITDSQTREVIDVDEITVSAAISEQGGHTLFFASDRHYSDVTEPAVWRELVPQIIKTIERRVRHAR